MFLFNYFLHNEHFIHRVHLNFLIYRTLTDLNINFTNYRHLSYHLLNQTFSIIIMFMIQINLEYLFQFNFRINYFNLSSSTLLINQYHFLNFYHYYYYPPHHQI